MAHQQLQQQQQQQQYASYAGPSTSHGGTGITPQDTAQQQPAGAQGQQLPGASGGALPLVATGDWTKDLVHLAKTAELKWGSLFRWGFRLCADFGGFGCATIESTR
jgi:hypothetical protein